ncbi:hypothetical protein BH11PAT3_BH11PAT3_1010 [soil metagenome]
MKLYFYYLGNVLITVGLIKAFILAATGATKPEGDIRQAVKKELKDLKRIIGEVLLWWVAGLAAGLISGLL